MRYAPIAKNAARALLITVIGLCTAVPAVHAQQVKGSHIEVMVCPQGSQSSMAIQSPVSDSIVSAPTVRISGSVRSISQIDFFVDDAYNNTLAVGLGEQAFASDVALDPGTHTVRLVAIDSCAQETHEDSIVVTYHPQLRSGTGSDTDTVLPAAGTTAAGADTPGAAPAAGSRPGAASSTDSGRALPPVIRKVLDGLDIGQGAPSQSGPRAAAQATSAIAGLAMLAGTPILLQMPGMRRFMSHVIKQAASSSFAGIELPMLRHVQLVLQTVGVLLLLAPFVA